MALRRSVALLSLLSLAMGWQPRLALRGESFAVTTPLSATKAARAAAYKNTRSPSPQIQMMAAKRKPKPKNSIGGYSPEKPWSKAQGAALYAFVYALIGALIVYRQANPVGGLPGVE